MNKILSTPIPMGTAILINLLINLVNERSLSLRNRKLCLFGIRRPRDSAFFPPDETTLAGLGTLDFLEIAVADRSGFGEGSATAPTPVSTSSSAYTDPSTSPHTPPRRTRRSPRASDGDGR